jgi:hypothetical protein
VPPDPNEYLRTNVLDTGDLIVELYLDANLNGAFDSSELTQSFIVRPLSFTGTVIKDRRTGGGPVEGTAYEVKDGEHFEGNRSRISG